VNPIVTWSTDAVPGAQRLDYFADALSSAIVPMQVERTRAGTLTSHMSMLEIDGVAVLAQRGSAHRSLRGQAEIGHSGAHTYHLILNRRAHWHIEHLGTTRVAAGEVFLVDSQAPVVIDMLSDYDVVHVMLPETWMCRWLRDPARLAGRVLGGPAGSMGPALAAFAAELSPQALQCGPQAARTMVDHLGAMLALGCQDASVRTPSQRAAVALYDQIVDCIANRSAEPLLTAGDIASGLSIAEDELHCTLGAAGHTFAGLLLTQRRCNAQRMLASRAFRAFTFDDIARRAGFDGGADLAGLLNPAKPR